MKDVGAILCSLKVKSFLEPVLVSYSTYVIICCQLLYHIPVGASLEAGTEVSATVLEIDLVECCLILSFNPQLLPNPGRLTRSASKRKSVVNAMGDPGEATVEYKTSSHFVLSYSRGSELGLAYGVMDSVSAS